LILSCLAWAAPVRSNERFLDLPLEDLLRIELSSASRKTQQVQVVAAAVFVISREEIERSGARTIPEALRLAPGIEVARMANNRWAISVRGFNGRFANKLLVLKDGRSIYSPLFSGVLWEAEDAILDDIERIEVIRGPGAAMWGSNAVNGVINIITRNAATTQGSKVIASTATDEPASLTVRHGLAVGDGHLRISAKGFNRAPSTVANGEVGNGNKGNDDWTAGRLGLRGDWPAADSGRWTLIADFSRSRADDQMDFSEFGQTQPLFDVKQVNRGSNLSLHREMPMADGGQIDWQVSAETSFFSVESLFREKRATFSSDIQRRLPLGSHELIVGASYRYSRDQVETTGPIPVPNPQQDWRIASVFANDELALIPERLRLSGGLRVDHDNWSGMQVQPNLRLAWTPDQDTTWWSSLARAARTPSRYELDIPYVVPGSTPALPPFVPAVQMVRMPPAAGSLQAERVNTLELGFRQRVTAQLSLDLVAFASQYSHLISFNTLAPQWVSPSQIFVPVVNANDATARTHGFEMAADWQVRPDWRLQANYSRLHLRSPRLADPIETIVQSWWEGRVPRHRASLRSSWSLQEGQQLDLWLKYTSRLGNPEVPAYTALDLRYAVRIGKEAEIALVGQNLLDKRHLEFVPDYIPSPAREIGRSLMLKGTWLFP
jgi:iron complex outermembrane receptor protein